MSCKLFVVEEAGDFQLDDDGFVVYSVQGRLDEDMPEWLQLGETQRQELVYTPLAVRCMLRDVFSLIAEPAVHTVCVTDLPDYAAFGSALQLIGAEFLSSGVDLNICR